MKKIIFVILFLSTILTTPDITSASNEKYKLMESLPFIGSAGDDTITFGKYLVGIYHLTLASIVIAALLMIVIGGYYYITSAGNQARAGNAKEIIWNAIIGLVIAFFVGILFITINPDILKFSPTGPKALVGKKPKGYVPSAGGHDYEGENGGGTQTSSDPAPTSLPDGCSKYKDTFNKASGGDKEFGCLLYGIGTQESSGCKPNMKSGAGACGIMQFMPSTGAKYGLGTCSALLNNPEKSIMAAAKFFNHNRAILKKYKFSDMGTSNNLSGATVTVGPYTYHRGNDDLIASYNAGAGTKSGSGKKGPFAPSKDCPGMPVWQCHINNSGFKETRDYVKKVQAYQKMCLEQNKL